MASRTIAQSSSQKACQDVRYRGNVPWPPHPRRSSVPAASAPSAPPPASWTISFSVIFPMDLPIQTDHVRPPASAVWIILFKIVDFPAPLGPMSVRISPFSSRMPDIPDQRFSIVTHGHIFRINNNFLSMAIYPLLPVYHDIDHHRCSKYCRHRTDRQLRGRKHGSGDQITEQAEHCSAQETGRNHQNRFRRLQRDSSSAAALQFPQRRSDLQRPSHRRKARWKAGSAPPGTDLIFTPIFLCISLPQLISAHGLGHEKCQTQRHKNHHRHDQHIVPGHTGKASHETSYAGSQCWNHLQRLRQNPSQPNRYNRS